MGNRKVVVLVLADKKGRCMRCTTSTMIKGPGGRLDLAGGRTGVSRHPAHRRFIRGYRADPRSPGLTGSNTGSSSPVSSRRIEPQTVNRKKDEYWHHERSGPKSVRDHSPVWYALQEKKKTPGREAASVPDTRHAKALAHQPNSPGAMFKVPHSRPPDQSHSRVIPYPPCRYEKRNKKEPAGASPR